MQTMHHAYCQHAISSFAHYLQGRVTLENIADQATHQTRVIHDQHAHTRSVFHTFTCRALWTASKTFSGKKGLSTKSKAPAWSAAMTGASWPRALHITMCALGCSCKMARTASIPSISGMVMSI